MHSFFQPESRADSDPFHAIPSAPAPPQPTMNFQQSNMQVSMDVLESLMNMQDGSGQAALAQQAQTTPQALLEQQMRLNQLQQLQQLQNQIFQQQIELLSGQSSFSGLSTPVDQQRDPQQYGLPTPASSTELRAQQSTDFVSPMILHSSASAMGGMQQQGPQGLPDYVTQHIIPPTPHSAPANLVFQTNNPYPLPSPAELDFGDISPLTSPWLGAYTNASPSTRGPSAPPTRKRVNGSSSGEESAATSTARPPRKRQSPTVRTDLKTPAQAGGASRKGSLRGSRSANSTPLFPAVARPARNGGGGAPNPGQIPADTPSPIEIHMPPPAHPPPAAPTGLLGPSTSADSGTSPTSSGMSTPTSALAPPGHIAPVTPASIMNLGRLGINTSTSSSHASSSRPKEGKGKSSEKRGAAAQPATVPKMANSSTSIISPSLKPIRPAGNMALNPPSSTSFAQPVMQVRKSSHKAAEQKRRDSLKTSFDDLRGLLPPIPLPSEEGYPDEPILPGAMPPRGPPKGNVEGPNRGVSKLQLLRCGNEYLKLLKGRIERRDDEIYLLRQEVARLRLAAPADVAGESLDLEKDLDAVESSGAGLFVRAGVSPDADEADEE
ncbi:hypothetical protein SCP_1400150 [Sparassis crispa]|uniref:BHLH domain-containing protein n=1 Tax=Sparassis crispa TaxID=139825 RepID=A0A401H2M1_9APHY|nr:hypothetical protein SCP_1400150 [Sparassis crispa]GBE88610.1 hypothetical protein SCP_1400150 [Sparassis crispa]